MAVEPMEGPAAAALDLTVRHDAAGALVSLTGELDVATGALVDALLHDLLRARRLPRVTRLAFDLSGVTFADAAGLSPLLYARAVLTRRQGSIEIVAASPDVRRLLVLLDLTILLAP
jgi:anti-anti-sigma factor